MDDILEEIKLMGDDHYTKYQLTRIDGLARLPTGIIMQKHSRFYKAINFAATSFAQTPNDDVTFIEKCKLNGKSLVELFVPIWNHQSSTVLGAECAQN